MSGLNYVYSNVYHSTDADLDGYALDDAVTIHAGECSLLYVYGVNNNVLNLRWLQVHDAAAEPAAGAVPLLSIPLDQVYGSDEWRAPHNGIRLANGLTCVSSTTPTTYTPTDSPDVYIMSQWF